jgi:adenylate kinase
MLRPIHLIIAGPPGAGKGTVSQLLCEELSLEHIAMGDILREHILAHDELGEKIAQPIKEGKFVPNKITEQIMKKKISSLPKKKGFLLDGFPRNKEQSEFIIQLTTISAVVKVMLDDQSIIKRLSQRRICPHCSATYHLKNNPPRAEGLCDVCSTTLIRRSDDEPEIIKARLALYHSEIKEVFNVLEKKGIPFVEVPGDFDLKTESNIILKLVKSVL